MAKKALKIEGSYLLKKFPGKGGWTYAEIPEISQNKNNPFGWVKVKGSIDGYKISQFKLMPMGEGRLFLPVKAAIRKAIQKEAGDVVHLTIEPDDSEFKVSSEILECFKNEDSTIYDTFLTFTEGERKSFIDWINAAKNEQTKADRIAKMMQRLEKGLRLSD